MAPQTTEQIRKHLQNRHLVLRSLHFDGPQRRVDLSRRCAIRKSSVTKIVGELMELGIVAATDPGNERSTLKLDDSKYCILTASVSANHVTVGRVYLDGRLQELSRAATGDASDPGRIAKRLVEKFRAAQKARSCKVLGYGVAVSGLTDPMSGTVVYSVSLGQWKDVKLGDVLSSSLRRPVLIDNNVRCQLWSSAWFGRLAARYQSILYVGIGQGVASAAVVAGRRVLGGHFSAGEIGHVRAGDEGRLCQCGRVDCLETFVGTSAIAREITQLRPDANVKTAEDIATAASSDRAVVNVVDRATGRLARALTGTIATLDPEALVIGSSSKAFSELVQPLLQRHLYTELMGFEAREAEIVIGEPTRSTTLTGVAGMVVERVFESGAEL